MSQPLSPNTVISRYRLLEKLGAGGMGEVWLAVDTKLGRKLALKFLPREFTRDPDRIARFEREARAASGLNHPNIITIYEIGEEGGVHFIATEFIEGHTLRRSMVRSGMNPAVALEIAVQVAGALAAAHETGITHRDVKPENIMVRPDGYAKVLDFGLAKLIENSPDSEAGASVRRETDPGTIMGTVDYMSPEQARGLSIDARSDIFSLGVVIYEMLAGRLPFSGPTPSDVIASILISDPASPGSVRPGIPPELDLSLMQALRKNRDERYQTIKDFLGDLRRIKSRLEFEMQMGRPGREWAESNSISEAPTVEYRLAHASDPSNPSNFLSARRFTSGQEIDSLAILPLANACDDSAMEYLSDGITESIINCLTQLPRLRVVPRSTVFRYKHMSIDPQKVGEELGVRAVLTGRVLQIGDSLIVKTELVDVAQESQLWGEQYRRKLTDIFDLQDEISQEISQKLRLQLTGDERQRLIKRYTDNSEAYHLYLKGRYYVGKRTPDWIKKGIEHFQQAIDLDPNYALAYSGMAEAFGFLASSTGGQPPREAYPKAEAAALKALELDEGLGEAHCTLGFFRLLYDWDFKAAEHEYLRAIELSPKFANAHDGYGFYLKATEQHAAAIESCRRALELDPLSLFLALSLGWAFYFARRYDEALEQSRKVLEMDPNFGFAYWHQGVVHMAVKEYGKAIASFRKALHLAGGIPSFIAYLGYANGKAGKAREARQMLSQLESLSRRQYVSAFFFAVIHMGLDHRPEMFEYLEKARQERAGFLAFLRVEPMFDEVRDDPLFTALIDKIVK